MIIILSSIAGQKCDLPLSIKAPATSTTGSCEFDYIYIYSRQFRLVVFWIFNNDIEVNMCTFVVKRLRIQFLFSVIISIQIIYTFQNLECINIGGIRYHQVVMCHFFLSGNFIIIFIGYCQGFPYFYPFFLIYFAFFPFIFV